MKLTRKYLTTVMLALILMPAIYSIYFQLQTEIIHSRMWRMLQGEASGVVMIHHSKLYWMEKDREILVNGLMFDVKSIEKVGDSLRITGEYDYEESGLYEKLESLHEEDNDQKREATRIHVLVQVMDDSISKFLISDIDLAASDRKLARDISTLPTVFLNTISPPPKA